MATSANTGAGVLGEIRRARRTQHRQRMGIFDAVYRAYVTILGGGVGIYYLVNLVAGPPVGSSGTAWLQAHGPGLIGLVGAVAGAVALGTAWRGGPVSLQPADVYLVTTAGIPTSAVVRRPALVVLRTHAVRSATLGAIVGYAGAERLGGAPVRWLVAGGVAGALMAAAAVGMGLAGAGRRIGRRAAGAIGGGAVGWSGLDAARGTVTSPISALGQVALAPWGVRWDMAVGIAFALGAAAWGIASIGGLSIEAAARRSELVSALRFSVNVRDLRAISLLRRELGHEGARRQPWLTLPNRALPKRKHSSPERGAVQRRDVRGLLRWPAARLVRLAALGALAGVCAVAAWAFLPPLFALSGVAMWLVALDAVEGLGQEVDHRERMAVLGYPAGWIYLRHLVVPVFVVAGAGSVAVAAAVGVGGGRMAGMVGAITLLPAASAAVAGAAWSVLREPVYGVDLVLPPEAIGVQLLLRELLPPAIAVSGLVPAIEARSAAMRGGLAPDAAINAALLVMIVPIAVFGWIQSKGRTPEAPRGRTPEATPGAPGRSPGGAGPATAGHPGRDRSPRRQGGPGARPGGGRGSGASGGGGRTRSQRGGGAG